MRIRRHSTISRKVETAVLWRPRDGTPVTAWAVRTGASWSMCFDSPRCAPCGRVRLDELERDKEVQSWQTGGRLIRVRRRRPEKSAEKSSLVQTPHTTATHTLIR